MKHQKISILESYIQEVFDSSSVEQINQLLIPVIKQSRINDMNKAKMLVKLKEFEQQEAEGLNKVIECQTYCMNSMFKKLGMGLNFNMLD